MIIECEQCHTRFKVPDDKLAAGGIRVRCSKCNHTFMASKDSRASPSTLTSMPAAQVAPAPVQTGQNPLFRGAAPVAAPTPTQSGLFRMPTSSQPAARDPFAGLPAGGGAGFEAQATAQVEAFSPSKQKPASGFPSPPRTRTASFGVEPPGPPPTTNPPQPAAPPARSTLMFGAPAFPPAGAGNTAPFPAAPGPSSQPPRATQAFPSSPPADPFARSPSQPQGSAAFPRAPSQPQGSAAFAQRSGADGKTQGQAEGIGQFPRAPSQPSSPPGVPGVPGFGMMPQAAPAAPLSRAPTPFAAPALPQAPRPQSPQATSMTPQGSGPPAPAGGFDDGEFNPFAGLTSVIKAAQLFEAAGAAPPGSPFAPAASPPPPAPTSFSALMPRAATPAGPPASMPSPPNTDAPLPPVSFTDLFGPSGSNIGMPTTNAEALAPDAPPPPSSFSMPPAPAPPPADPFGFGPPQGAFGGAAAVPDPFGLSAPPSSPPAAPPSLARAPTPPPAPADDIDPFAGLEADLPDDPFSINAASPEPPRAPTTKATPAPSANAIATPPHSTPPVPAVSEPSAQRRRRQRMASLRHGAWIATQAAACVLFLVVAVVLGRGGSLGALASGDWRAAFTPIDAAERGGDLVVEELRVLTRRAGGVDVVIVTGVVRNRGATSVPGARVQVQFEDDAPLTGWAWARVDATALSSLQALSDLDGVVTVPASPAVAPNERAPFVVLGKAPRDGARAAVSVSVQQPLASLPPVDKAGSGT